MKLLHLFFLICLLSGIPFKSFGGEKVDEGDIVIKIEHEDSLSSTLLLLSKGLTTDTLRKTFVQLLDKEPWLYSVAVVVNASSTEKKKVKKTKKVKTLFSDLDFDSTKVDLFDFMKTSPKKLLEYDITYILGGNPFLLLDEIKKSGADTVLSAFANSGKLLMGYSAGSLVLGPDLTLMDYVDTLLGFNELEMKELSGLGLYDFHIFPHYSDFTNQLPELITKIEAYEANSNLPVYRLNDNQAILFQNGKIQLIGQ